jgi:type I restriction-modification system DNA methylase subunit
MPDPRRISVPDDRQLVLPLYPFRNSNFLSNHWLEHRLPLEPEWADNADYVKDVMEGLLTLWKTEKDRVELYGDEAGLEHKFIQPVFEKLGWHIKYQTYLNGREPDYALFANDAALDAALHAGRNHSDFWSHATLVADAKAWHVSLDRPIREGVRREYPPEQIEWYLNRSLCDYGILTNGRLWRLVPRELGPSKPRFQSYLEIDLPQLLDSLLPAQGQLALGPGDHEFENLLRFVLFFSPLGFSKSAGRKALVDRAVAGSSEYSLGVGEELKDRVFEALRLCVEGFVKYSPNRLDPATDLQTCQEHSLVFLYRLLFIMYAEDRALLPYRINHTYTVNRSLARHRDDVANKLDLFARGLDRTDYSADVTDIWDDLQDLFDLIDRGHQRYGVQAYNGGLFDLEADEFLSRKKLPDWFLARVLDQLGRASLPTKSDLGLFRVDYRDLAIQQLGSVYEGLLELKPRYAEAPMRVLRPARNEGPQLIVPADAIRKQGYEETGIIYEAESVYLSTDKGERRRTGSYYTPDHIVETIVQQSIGPVCAEVDKRLSEEIECKKESITNATPTARVGLEAEIAILEGSFADRILNLSILDPAMGSGHFLIRACQYLAEEIATNPHTREEQAHTGDESTITFWKRRVSENCLYGVDSNPMAVELAKLALWLETVAADAPLTFLDHHFRHGDSIIGARIKDLERLPDEDTLFKSQFADEIQNALPNLLAPLGEIRELASDTAEQVKRKDQIFKRRFLPALSRFSTVANVWTAEALQARIVQHEQYSRIVGSLNSKRKFDNEAETAWVKHALALLKAKSLTPLHWELAYPEVFLSDDPNRKRGFDVILGNPPYDVLSEREIGHSIEHLRRFISLDDTLEPSLVGKNNLYKLFICRSLHLLAEGGYLSFIVPMAVLGDEQSSGIRHALLSMGAFSLIHAFPQKDNISRRVFRDAKLATALFVYRKQSMGSSTLPFHSYVHPAQFVDPNSSRLSLDSNSIKLYDPENLTIVSCSQSDWDLMASLHDSEIARLATYVDFFQGEVNQTVATASGHLTTAANGPLVIRGANICLYQLREASQGEDIYLDVSAYLEGKGRDTKAFHHLIPRVGLQESSPQNNFRRIIACKIDGGLFCNHTINYTTERNSRLRLELVLFVLNSSFADWYFRLGSTNAHVSHYQLKNIPCPRFLLSADKIDTTLYSNLKALLDARDIAALEEQLLSLATRKGCNSTVEEMIVNIVRVIEEHEKNRGEISRTSRSSLSDFGQTCQALLDKLMLVLIGIDVNQASYIKHRLEVML